MAAKKHFMAAAVDADLDQAKRKGRKNRLDAIKGEGKELAATIAAAVLSEDEDFFASACSRIRDLCASIGGAAGRLARTPE